ncbi:MAG: DsbA family protein [Nocardioides sp.]|uniref:DsbA family protein n=1 Tax=Nocardioides sp. TaxID=35761 RepID=UPI0039E6F15D
MSKKSTERSRAERTAALIKEQQRAERRRQLTIVVVITAVLALIVGVYLFFALKHDPTPHTAKDSEFGLVIGPEDAKTKIVVYEDFLCPVCQYFESKTRDKLQAAADAGDVSVEYRPFFFLQQFGDYSERATNAFRAVWVESGDDAALKMHNELYENQPSEEGPFPDNDWLVEKAVAAGADEDTIRPAIEDMKEQKWVDEATKDASQIQGTPTVYVNGDIVEAGTIDGVVAQVLTAIG